jgi:hypothetical protein
MLEHDSFGFIFATTIEKESGFLPVYRVSSVTLFSAHALRGIKNKKPEGYNKIRMLK